MERRVQSKIEELPPEQYQNLLLVRKNQLEQLITQKQKEISMAPRGRLRVSTNKGTYQYYKITENADTLGSYISKNNIFTNSYFIGKATCYKYNKQCQHCE